MSGPDQSYTRNLLLSSMAAQDWALLQPHLTRVELPRGQILYEPDRPLEHACFIEAGVASILSNDTGDEVEIGLVGREGFVGTFLLLGSDRTPDHSLVQIGPLVALRIAAAPLLEATGRSASLRQHLLRFVMAATIQAARTAASNAGAEIPARLARWLLMCHDRLDGDTLPLTHEFISQMLAVRRAGVTVALHVLEGVGAIGSKRGEVVVRDRQKLLELAGDTYGVPEREYRRLLGPFGKST